MLGRNLCAFGWFWFVCIYVALRYSVWLDSLKCWFLQLWSLTKHTFNSTEPRLAEWENNKGLDLTVHWSHLLNVATFDFSSCARSTMSDSKVGNVCSAFILYTTDLSHARNVLKFFSVLLFLKTNKYWESEEDGCENRVYGVSVCSSSDGLSHTPSPNPFLCQGSCVLWPLPCWFWDTPHYLHCW